jgi:hypothetical protein
LSSYFHTLIFFAQQLYYHIGTNLFLEKDGVQKDGRSNEQGLLVRRRLFGKGNVKCVGIREQLDAKRLWFLDDFTKMFRIATRIGLSRRKDPERNLQAALTTTWVTLGADLHATSTAARGRVDEIELLPIRIKDIKRRNATPEVLPD